MSYIYIDLGNFRNIQIFTQNNILFSMLDLHVFIYWLHTNCNEQGIIVQAFG